MDRPLTPGETALAATIFGGAIDYSAARIANRKWAFFQPKRVTMAPMGCICFHPEGGLYREDFADAALPLRALFLHEMTHVWQTQTRGRWYLPLARHPFCRYAYAFDPGRPFRRYGIEQQAEIVRHAFLLANGATISGKPGAAVYRAMLPFN